MSVCSAAADKHCNSELSTTLTSAEALTGATQTLVSMITAYAVEKIAPVSI